MHTTSTVRTQQKTKKTLEQEGIETCEACGWQPPVVAGVRLISVLHLHHIVPLAKGGENDRANLILLCPNCHALAHAKGSNKNGRHGLVSNAEVTVREDLIECLHCIREGTYSQYAEKRWKKRMWQSPAVLVART